MCKYKYAALCKQETSQLKLSYICRIYNEIATKSKYPGAEQPIAQWEM